MEQFQSTILAVDDKPDNLFVITRLIHEYLPGCRLVTASSASDGLAMAVETLPDCALIDVQMPGTDGIAMCGLLKANPLTAGMPVILMTAHRTDTQLRVRGLEAGADDFIAKPIDNIELMARIKVVLRIRKAEESLRKMNEHLEELVLQRTEALRESQSSFRTVADGLPVLIAHVDAEQRYRFANRAFAEWFGLSPTELTGRKVEDIVDDVLYARIQERIESALSGKHVSFEGETLLGNGAGHHYHAQLIPQAGEGGNVQGYFLIVQDITEKKKREQALLRLATAVEQSGEVFLLVDKHHIIQYANPAYEDLTGRLRHEVRNQKICSIWSDAQHKTLHDAIWDTVCGGATWTGRIAGVKKDGAPYEAETTASPVLDESGNLCDYVITMRDVSRIAALEQQVRQMQKMEAIGTLAGGIAHDFNNILSPVIGYTEMALEGLPESSQLRRDLEQILLAGNRARCLVQQILAFSRQAEEEQKPVRVGNIVKEALELLGASIPSTIEIRTHIARDAESCTVQGDPSQIHQILMNLCTNAKHAMHGKAGLLDVELVRWDIPQGRDAPGPGLGSGPYLRLSVKDTGDGMESEVRKRIFDPFFTTKPPGEGTGMGLAVVYGIVRGHGGAITVESEPEKGSVFHVFLPCTGCEAASTIEPSEPLPTGHERVLFVDDEATLVALGKRLLTKLGYEVTTRTNAHEALRTFRQEPDGFDLVVTDYTMPHMTGVDFSKEVFTVRPDIPVILCSGFSAEITPEQAKAAGIREFLMKPVATRDLARVVRRVLDEKTT